MFIISWSFLPCEVIISMASLYFSKFFNCRFFHIKVPANYYILRKKSINMVIYIFYQQVFLFEVGVVDINYKQLGLLCLFHLHHLQVIIVDDSLHREDRYSLHFIVRASYYVNPWCRNHPNIKVLGFLQQYYMSLFAFRPYIKRLCILFPHIQRMDKQLLHFFPISNYGGI